MASVQQPPPPPPSSSGMQPLPVQSFPCPRHAAIPWTTNVSPPVQEPGGSSEALYNLQGASAPSLHTVPNGSQFSPSQDGTAQTVPDDDDQKKCCPVQETEPVPEAVGLQPLETDESRVRNEVTPQINQDGEKGLP